MIELRKPVRRIIATRDGDALVVTLTVEGLTVREKGKRRTYGPIPYGRLFLQAAEMATGKPSIARPRPRGRGGRRT